MSPVTTGGGGGPPPPTFPLAEDHPPEVVVDRLPEVVEDYPQISLEMEEDRRRMHPTMVEVLSKLITTSTLGSTTSTRQ